MALRKYTVPLPEKHTSADKSGKYPYVYHRSNYRRNDKGQPVHDRTLIGKLDPENPGQMFPNDNYYKIYPHEDQREFQSPGVRGFSSCGATLFLSLLSERLGITALLERIFPRYWEGMLQIAMYMLCRGNVMMYLDDFYEEHHPIFVSAPCSRYLSVIFESVDEDSIRDFMEAWQAPAATKARKTVCYNVKSISTAGRDIDLAERGYNQDHEYLSQINVALFYSQTSRLPVCYELSSRSSDVSQFEILMRAAMERHLDSSFLVLEHTSVDTDDILYLKKCGIPFAMAVTHSDPVFWEPLLEHSDAARGFDRFSRQTRERAVSKAISGSKKSVFSSVSTMTLRKN
ncbi:MAG: hypothetical protein QM296_11715 [Bacillota bacterium]|nr:hypothetical protein [Bacillota bacterium]